MVLRLTLLRRESRRYKVIKTSIRVVSATTETRSSYVQMFCEVFVLKPANSFLIEAAAGCRPVTLLKKIPWRMVSKEFHEIVLDAQIWNTSAWLLLKDYQNKVVWNILVRDIISHRNLAASWLLQGLLTRKFEREDFIVSFFMSSDCSREESVYMICRLINLFYNHGKTY